MPLEINIETEGSNIRKINKLIERKEYYAATAEKIKEMDADVFLQKYDIFDTGYMVIEQFKYELHMKWDE